MGKGESMSDTEKEIDELQRKLAAKTSEIEALVADEQELGDINAMESTDYTRLKTYVEELIEKWQEADVDRSGSNPDTPVNRLTPIVRRSRSKSSLCNCDEFDDALARGLARSRGTATRAEKSSLPKVLCARRCQQHN
jgi:hypothetical protein